MLDNRIVENILEFLQRTPIQGKESDAMTETKAHLRQLLAYNRQKAAEKIAAEKAIADLKKKAPEGAAKNEGTDS